MKILKNKLLRTYGGTFEANTMEYGSNVLCRIQLLKMKMTRCLNDMKNHKKSVFVCDVYLEKGDGKLHTL